MADDLRLVGVGGTEVDPRGYLVPGEEVAREEIRVGVHVVCELLAGAEGSQRPTVERQRVRRLCGSLVVSYPDERFASVYARLLAALRGGGRPIATMDLLIGWSALPCTRKCRRGRLAPGLERS
jgi:hypothetical protein